MKAEPTCPRCGGPVHPPSVWSSDWRCDEHGAVYPLQAALRPARESIDHLCGLGGVPVWVPWPLPGGWLVTGFAYAGDERTGMRASAVACSGPAPLGGPADLVLVAEEPGVGLGARFAGLANADPGDGFDAGAANARIQAAGRPTPMWWVDAGADAAAYVGEAKARWIWAVLWPADAGILLLDDFVAIDLRDKPLDIDIPYGALTPRIAAPPPRR